MHISRIDLNLFVVLDTIYREGNITRASQALKLSQPALSHALGRLRELLKDPLFVRQGSAMVPTSLTRNLIGPVRQSLQTLELSVRQSQRFDPAQTRRQFHLGLRDVFEATILPALIRSIECQASGVELISARTDRRTLEAELAAGALDLALDIPLPTSDAIRQTRVSRDRLIVMARTGHPALRDLLTLADYLAQTHILVSSRRQGRGLEDFELNREGYRRRIGLRCQHYFAACRVVSQTDWLLTMPEQYACIANAQFGNRIMPFPLPTQPLDVHLYWHVSVDHDPANQWLREQCIALFAQEGRGRTGATAVDDAGCDDGPG
ncbi:MAG TPA: LysR family transcriptional regulator [Candidatus Competibacteraceae bacterium]|nr:LysR family transcriptional regulator [Candidatus Competibacteraceae bacterium]HQA25901.1 LysR family transcriptional regulator [Candidatus Competibacteraceae bacterium]HQD57528.1 LysR family transcriptional regulator [Candidatus Competibacteraceae bacterium]